MRIAYADPPYIGQAKRHYADDPSGIAPEEVDHAALIADLERDYDGWALSCSAASLPEILTLMAPIWNPKRHRVLAWVKPFCSWKSVNPAYAWEPVIIKQPRGSNYPRVRDYLAANMTTQTGTHGAKPLEFSYWLFCALNLTAEDDLIDLFPGSRGVLRAWDTWRRTAPVETKRKRAQMKQPTLLEVTA